jgi:predicted enzyme related to lactoylglutathione lyase
MERVTGIGGIFFKSEDPKKLGEWYRKHLGIPVEPWNGAVFETGGQTVWSPFPKDTKHFGPSGAPFMVNYRVANLFPLLEQLREEGVTVEERTETSEQGTFGWIMDPEGNRIELWEPPA